MPITLKPVDDEAIEIPLSVLLSQRLDLNQISALVVLMAMSERASNVQPLVDRWFVSPQFQTSALELKKLGIVSMVSKSVEPPVQGGKTSITLSISVDLTKV